MCIALPCRVLAVVDADLMLVAVSGETDGDKEVVSAALVVTPQRPVATLVGAFVLIHAGFALTLIDEAEAQSRLQVFAALRGGNGAIDLDDFYAVTADARPASGMDGDSPAHPDTGPRSNP
ncbi:MULTISPECIES: HypC/HybG/HupF family hydrogenase formation chaperone [Rhodopseudomonas]|uniref:HypC/HybG/HupF family hydrogenase formation chaperone n=1 Tax=Rhodopseudomonas TaxID=1073 RepID=UPI000697B7DF|nr:MULTISPECIES: HypC/HybG/HupF family hydrogenase formation chaperone [Rhodopseudomonas]MDF3809527.1 HypC/HybG/HupF family hydrogenase formation chaperone [Rhodopseudomonas sp. BAL398]WOK19729.1 HypC/HybG/HupF family hydrogenase formation chaperone [Rhodopseudomonas sp. BAL398]